jgi:tetratricopeptide (TPR) repeat protein/mono/diheme cytochrome c family protein
MKAGTALGSRVSRWGPVALAMVLATTARAETPTFNRDIAPIVHASCAACHHPGGAGPFSLLAYHDAKKRARQIAAVTAARYMPPWQPEPGKGAFVGERRLTDEQIALIRRWVETDAPEGDPADRRPPPRFPDGWPLGEPDLVVKLPKPWTLAPGGADVFRNFVLPVPVTRTRYVRALEIRLDDRRVAHHANVLVDRTQSSRRRDALDPEPGFPGMELAMESERFDPDSHFLFWKPGSMPYEEPADMAWRLDPGTDLVLDMHLKPSGKPEPVQPQVGLYFTDRAPTRHPMLLQLEHDGALDIPPGAKGFVVTDEIELPVAVEVLGIYPHAHYLGKEVRGEAILPDGSRQWLIHIKDWDVNWQAVYRYAKPFELPKGTRLAMRWTYDNSADNVRNPSVPPRRVTAGNRAEDEMAHLWLQVLPRSEAAGDPRILLQEALMRARLRKYPGDFTALYNLGAALQAAGRLEEAVGILRQAVAADAANPTARNSLGTALQARGDLEGAIREYEEAIRLRPDEFNARYNRGQVLLAQGRATEASGAFREALRLRPDDSGAHAQFGVARLAAGDAEGAIDPLRRALRADPDHLNARYNLGLALARKGELDGAERELAEVVRRKPDDPDSLDALGLVLMAEGRTAEAAARFRESLRIMPDGPTAHDALGQLRFAEGDAGEAIGHFQAVIKARPDDADARNNLGSALVAAGRLAEAANEFERALAIDPRHAVARANLDRVRAALAGKK